MDTVTIDKTGKIYLPKSVREKIKQKRFVAAVLPDGTIMLHKVKRFKNPEDALKEFQTLPKVTKPIQRIKKEIEEEALRTR